MQGRRKKVRHSFGQETREGARQGSPNVTYYPKHYGTPREERKAAPPVAEAAAWSSNEAQSSDSFSWLNDNAEL